MLHVARCMLRVACCALRTWTAPMNERNSSSVYSCAVVHTLLTGSFATAVCRRRRHERTCRVGPVRLRVSLEAVIANTRARREHAHADNRKTRSTSTRAAAARLVEEGDAVCLGVRLQRAHKHRDVALQEVRLRVDELVREI